MRILFASFLPLLVLLGACTHRPAAVGAASCEVDAVPRAAVFGTREGRDIATWPPEMGRGASGCQRVWYGDRLKPEAMQVLATYYYDQGHVQRLVGRVPGGAPYDCHYRDGTLDSGRSQNPAQCPKVSELEGARR
jgi:hypothetical protein